MCACIPLCICEGQKTIYGSQFSPSTKWVLGSDSGHQTWWQAPLLNEPPGQPWLISFKIRTLSLKWFWQEISTFAFFPVHLTVYKENKGLFCRPHPTTPPPRTEAQPTCGGALIVKAGHVVEFLLLVFWWTDAQHIRHGGIRHLQPQIQPFGFAVTLKFITP